MALIPPTANQRASPIPGATPPGTLPDRRPDAMWAGRSTGGDCAICGVALEREELEYELEYVTGGPDPGVETRHVHIRCFTAYIWKARGKWGDRSRHEA